MIKSIPIPLILIGGLFILRTSVAPTDEDAGTEILTMSQSILRSDPSLSMELGPVLEAGCDFFS